MLRGSIAALVAAVVLAVSPPASANHGANGGPCNVDGHNPPGSLLIAIESPETAAGTFGMWIAFGYVAVAYKTPTDATSGTGYVEVDAIKPQVERTNKGNESSIKIDPSQQRPVCWVQTGVKIIGTDGSLIPR